MQCIYSHIQISNHILIINTTVLSSPKGSVNKLLYTNTFAEVLIFSQFKAQPVPKNILNICTIASKENINDMIYDNNNNHRPYT